MRVLFVCSGNICRSAMAAELMRHHAVLAGARIEVDSAGTLGIESAPASKEAVEAMREVGLDLANHRSQGVRAEHLDAADVVVAMAGAHLLELASRFPRARTPRFLLRAFEHGPRPDPDPPDLEDPIGLPIAVYREQVGIIRRCVENLAAYLERSR